MGVTMAQYTRCSVTNGKSLEKFEELPGEPAMVTFGKNRKGLSMVLAWSSKNTTRNYRWQKVEELPLIGDVRRVVVVWYVKC